MGQWFKGWRFYAAVSILPAALSVAVVLFFWPDSAAWTRTQPKEGYYWSADQYSRALARTREELRAYAAGEPLDAERLDTVVSVLRSTGDRLLAPSKLQEGLRTVPGYSAMAQQLAYFDKEVIETARRPDFDRGSARQLVAQFSSFEPVVQDWLEATRARDLTGFDEFLKSIADSRHEALIASALLCAAAAAWIFSILSERRRVHTVARERLDALEAEKLAKVQMEAAVRAKSQFLSMVSHELRSPLQAILSSVDLLKLHISPAEREQAIQRIRRSSMVLGVQLRDLLTLARGEAGKLEIRPESFEARALMDDMAEVAGDRARDKGLEFRMTMPNVPIFAMADVLRISQVLANLVSNAIKYTEKGLVTLELDPAPVGSGRLVFHVTDTGAGIPPERLNSAFEPFERVGAPGKADESWGIGLTIVRTVVSHLGGTLEIKSTEGVGTRVTVSVPALIEDPEAVHGETGNSNKVLIVEDRGDIRSSMYSLAVKMGYDCDVADSAAAAANYLAAIPYYTVLVDLDMPIKGGIELATETRRLQGPNQNTYIAAMSAVVPDRPLVPWPFDHIAEKVIETPRLVRLLNHRAKEQQR